MSGAATRDDFPREPDSILVVAAPIFGRRAKHATSRGVGVCNPCPLCDRPAIGPNAQRLCLFTCAALASVGLVASCRQSTAPAQGDASSPASSAAVLPSTSSVTPVSVIGVGLDPSRYAPVDLENLYDPKWNEKDVALETIVEPPKKNPAGDPQQICRPAQEGTLGFPDVDTPGAPICFRLEKGLIDPASVIPRAAVRARMRGRFHKSPAVDEPWLLERTWLTLDAFEVVPEGDYAPTTVAQIVARGAAVHLDKVVVEGEWLGFFESWTIYDLDAPPGHGGSKYLCLYAEQHVGGASKQRARVRGHLFAHGGYGHMDGCKQMLLIDSVDLL